MKFLARFLLLPAVGTVLLLSPSISLASVDTERETIREYRERLEAAETPEQREAVVAEMRETALRERVALEKVSAELREIGQQIPLASGEEREALIAQYRTTQTENRDRSRFIARLGTEYREARVLSPEERAEREERSRQLRDEMEIRREFSRELRGLPFEEQMRIRRETGRNPDQIAEKLEKLREAREARESSGELGEMPENSLDRWVFSSFITLAGEPLFSLQNPWENETIWASTGEHHHGIEIGAFDAFANTLTLRSGNQTRVVRLGDSARRRSSPTGTRNPPKNLAVIRMGEIWEEALPHSETLRETDRELREFSKKFAATQIARRLLSPEMMDPEEMQARMAALNQEMFAMVRQSNEWAESLTRRAMETPFFSGEDEEHIRQFFRNRIHSEANREMTRILHPDMPVPSL